MQARISPLFWDQQWSRWGTIGILFFLPFQPLSPSHLDDELWQSKEFQLTYSKLQKRLPTEYRWQAKPIAKSIVENADRHDLPVSLILAVMETESSFQPQALSKAGARGLLQLLPQTAEEVARMHDIPYSGAEELWNPIKNIELGTAYLAYLKKRFSQQHHFLAAYNFGPTAIQRRLKNGDRWLENTKFYVNKIQGLEKGNQIRMSLYGPI